MPTVVVTGVAGSLGQRVAALLCARRDVDRVVGIDVVPPSRPIRSWITARSIWRPRRDRVTPS